MDSAELIAVDPFDAGTRRSRIAFLSLAATTLVVLVGLGLGMTFFADEWAFIASRSLGDPGSWFVPHNEHWVTLPVVVYRALVETVGISSYVPYQLTVVLLHIGVAGLTYRLLERSAGPRFALIGGTIVLLLGGGFENLFWAFQISFVGSTMFGLAALLVTDREPSGRQAWLVALLLLASLASSGVGVVMSIAVGVEWLLNPRWRRFIPYLVVPAASFLAWYLAFGQFGLTTHRDPFTLSALASVPRFVLDGVATVISTVAGVPVAFGLVVLAAVVAAVGVRHPRRLRSPRVLAIAVAIVIQYALAALIRAHLLDSQAEYTRYVYAPVILAIVAAGTLVRGIRTTRSDQKRLYTTIGLLAWATLALVLNLRLLLAGREVFLARSDLTRALVTVAMPQHLPAGVDPSRSLILVPAPADLRRIVAVYGDPLRDSLAPWSIRPIPAEVLAEAERRLRGGATVPIRLD